MAIVFAAAALPFKGVCLSRNRSTSSISIKSSMDCRRVHDFTAMRCKSPLFGSSTSVWLSMGRDLCLSKVFVAADDSDSESSDTHPTRLSPVEIARTTVEAHGRAVLSYRASDEIYKPPVNVWYDAAYRVTSSGGFEIPHNPFHFENDLCRVEALIGIDNSKPTRIAFHKMCSEYGDYHNDDSFIKVLEMEWEKQKKYSPNGVYILGYFFISVAGACPLLMQKVRLLSVYGSKFDIEVKDFRNAKPDILAGYSSEILEPFNKNCTHALKTLCKKKGLYIEEARFIGVDRLGTDVRVFKGKEMKTHRFPFKAQVKSVFEAKKQIQQLLYP